METNEKALPPNYQVLGDTLIIGGQIQQNQCLVSQNGGYCLVMQTDGNLVLYVVTAGGPNRSLWSTGTNNGSYASINNEGDFVVYDNNNNVVYDAGCGGNKGNRGIMQDDGNFVVYAPVWSTNTYQ